MDPTEIKTKQHIIKWVAKLLKRKIIDLFKKRIQFMEINRVMINKV